MMEEREHIYRRALSVWGSEAQLGMVQEECAELIAAIQRLKRGRVGIRAVVEEAADVAIMAEQVRVLFGERLFDDIRDRKIARLRERLQVKA